MPITLTKEYLIEEYVNKQRSYYDIAKSCNTYPNKILRLLQKYNIQRRSHSDAQRLALESGRTQHPTKGSKRSEAVRDKIGKNVAIAWNDLDEEEKAKRALSLKNRWKNMSEEEKIQFKKIANQAIKKSAKYGSKLERFLLTELRNQDYDVVFHKRNIISNENVHVDIFLPSKKIAIEVDGPSHYLPIWGEDVLQKRQTLDAQKNGLLVNDGYIVIRIINLKKNTSKILCKHVLTKLLNLLESMDKQTEKIFTIEV